MSPTWRGRDLVGDPAADERRCSLSSSRAAASTDTQNCAMTLGTGAISGSSSIVAKGTEGHRKPRLKQLWTAVVASGVVP